MHGKLVVSSFLLLGLFRLAAQVADTLPMIELSADDSAKAAALHQQVVDAQKDWDSLQKAIRDRLGRNTGIFSEDFRFLVGPGDPAPLVELNTGDTGAALAAHNLIVKAQQDWLDFRSYVMRKYLAASASDTSPVLVIDNVRIKPGREMFQHFRFDQEYHFLVPG
jgi:hypothetical protein